MTDDVRALYRRHEQDVLRGAMARVRSPEVAVELTAETFAHALVDEHDGSRWSEREWLSALAEEALEDAYRRGTVGTGWRERARIATIAVDARALERVWRLRGPDRDAAPKPRASAALVVTERGPSGETVLPAVEAALVAAAGRRGRSRRRRRRASIAVRVAVAVLSVGWLVGPALVPDRPARAAALSDWLPFARAGVEGFYPRLWYLATSPQAPDGAREAVAISTFPTGYERDACGALATMGESDALVFVFRVRPDAAALRRCAPDAELVRQGKHVIVLGPSAPEETRALARQVLDRIRPDGAAGRR